MGYYQTIYEQGAALLQSLVGNHAFVDGNKRVGFTLTSVFLLLNGYRLQVSANVGESFIVENLIGKRADLAVIAKWLEKHSEAIKVNVEFRAPGKARKIIRVSLRLLT